MNLKLMETFAEECYLIALKGGEPSVGLVLDVLREHDKSPVYEMSQEQIDLRHELEHLFV